MPFISHLVCNKLPLLRFKEGVHIIPRHFDPKIRVILDVVRATAPPTLDEVIWVTSADDGEHRRQSKHYSGEAFDIRIRNLECFEWGQDGNWIIVRRIEQWAEEIRDILGPDYDVLYANVRKGKLEHLSHIHIEYDKKR